MYTYFKIAAGNPLFRNEIKALLDFEGGAEFQIRGERLKSINCAPNSELSMGHAGLR